jgi:hypothetical protein
MIEARISPEPLVKHRHPGLVRVPDDPTEPDSRSGSANGVPDRAMMTKLASGVEEESWFSSGRLLEGRADPT